jgi:DnaJ-domain-containing protein 1
LRVELLGLGEYLMSEKREGCVFCGTPFSDVAGHVCAKCGAPQPVAASQDHFTLLGVKRGFKQNLQELETNFYAISRALHPDRFAGGSDQKWKLISVERMSAVNRAYQTLTKADRLRSYLLELEGIKPAPEKAQIPAELAEEWFELQDAVMENPETAVRKLEEFESALRARSKDLAGRILNYEIEYDAGSSAPRETLLKIEKLVLDGQYLKSMERDLLRLKSRLGI